MNSVEETRSKIYLMEELQVSVSVVKSGLAILQQSASTYPRHFLILLTLSTGFERIMKILLNLKSLDSKGHFLTEAELKRFGHNLIMLRDEIVERCYDETSLQTETMREDYNFLVNNSVFTQLLHLLSDFARRDRYIYMNGISDPGQAQKWLSDGWTSIENQIIDRARNARIIREFSASDLTTIDEAIEHATREIIICIEKYLRALARIVTLCDFSSEAKSLGSGILEFIMLDNSLGTKEYKI